MMDATIFFELTMLTKGAPKILKPPPPPQGLLWHISCAMFELAESIVPRTFSSLGTPRNKRQASQHTDVEERYVLLFRLASLAAKAQKHPEFKHKLAVDQKRLVSKVCKLPCIVAVFWPSVTLPNHCLKVASGWVFCFGDKEQRVLKS